MSEVLRVLEGAPDEMTCRYAKGEVSEPAHSTQAVRCGNVGIMRQPRCCGAGKNHDLRPGRQWQCFRRETEAAGEANE